MKLFLISLCGMLAVQGFGAGNDWRIVPGERVGQITMGMERAEVIRLLGTPGREDDLEYLYDKGQKLEYLKPRKEGEYKDLLRDDWTVPIRWPNGKEEEYHMENMANFVSIYFRNLRVVQIDVNVGRFKTREGLSAESTGIAWQKRFPKYTETFHKYFHQSAGGWPATKIFGDYDDAVSEGVAWYFSCTGDLAPDPDPEGPVTVAVHEANKPVIVDPDGGGRFMFKARPNQLSGDL